MQKTEENNVTTILINKDGRKHIRCKDGVYIDELIKPTIIFKTTKYDKELLMSDPYISE
jgi:hypothetical protein